MCPLVRKSHCLSLRLVLVKSLANKYSCNLVDIRLSKCPLMIKDPLPVCPFVFTARPRRYKTLEVSISEKIPVCLPLQHVLADIRPSKCPLVRKNLGLFVFTAPPRRHKILEVSISEKEPVYLFLQHVLADIRYSKSPLVRKNLGLFVFTARPRRHKTLRVSISEKSLCLFICLFLR